MPIAISPDSLAVTGFVADCLVVAQVTSPLLVMGVAAIVRRFRQRAEPVDLSTADVIRAVSALEGVTLNPRALSRWARIGLVVPSRWDGRRGRHGRGYSVADLNRLLLVVRLQREGVSASRLREVLAFVETELPEVLRPGSKAVLLADRHRGRPVIVRRPGRADAEVPSGQLRLEFGRLCIDEKTAARLVAA